MKQQFQTIFILLLLMVGSAYSFAQEANLDVQLNKSTFRSGDTIEIAATQSTKKGSLATLFLMAEHEDGMVWEMRWPMLNGQCEAALIVPDSVPEGPYRLRFSVLQNLFTVFGKVKTPEKIQLLQSTLLTHAGAVYESETNVQPDGSFTYKNVLFDKDATLLFTLPDAKSSDALNIEIATILDSVVKPGSGKNLDIFIGNQLPASELKKFTSNEGDSSLPAAQVLQAVTVYSKPSNRGEIFNKKYSSGLFKDMNERVINLLDNPMLQNWNSVLQIIRSQAAGIIITGGINPTVRWRGDGVQFYLDEMRVPIETIDMMPVFDIAIIKLYPPPFFGNPGGGGGAVAIYTKRGGLTDDGFKNAFKVTGYTPLVSQFPVSPDRL